MAMVQLVEQYCRASRHCHLASSPTILTNYLHYYYNFPVRDSDYVLSANEFVESQMMNCLHQDRRLTGAAASGAADSKPVACAGLGSEPVALPADVEQRLADAVGAVAVGAVDVLAAAADDGVRGRFGAVAASAVDADAAGVEVGRSMKLADP